MSYFLIGLTKQKVTAKRQGYVTEGIQHFVVLADGLTHDQALEIEGALQMACFQDPALESRYHPEKSRFHRRSVGGIANLDGVYSIYLAWYSQAEEAVADAPEL